MNNIKEIRKENKLLQREIYLRIINSNYSQEEKVKLQQNFTNNYYDIIKLSFDIGITKEKLDKYSKQIKDINNPSVLLKIARVVENENTYILLNRYLKEYYKLL
jgi:hypothetical protein